MGPSERLFPASKSGQILVPMIDATPQTEPILIIERRGMSFFIPVPYLIIGQAWFLSEVRRNGCGIHTQTAPTASARLLSILSEPYRTKMRSVLLKGLFPPEMELDLILQQCRAGDELAWEALVSHFQSRVYGIAYHYLNDADEARDLAQEVFVRIFKNIAGSPEAGAFGPWLIRISRNACIDHLRRRNARPPAQDISSAGMRDLRSSQLNPEEQWSADSRKSLLKKALRGLSLLNREIIVLKEIQGLSIEEISSLLSVPVGTVKSRSHRARLELARKLAANKG
jgi:RNA polymerase sigma-70 factor (ECF subfamily)